MEELDRRTIEGFGMPSIVLMENAGRCVAEVAAEMLKRSNGNRIAVFCGRGNNGGDGFVAARYLARQDVDVKVYLVGNASRVKNDSQINLDILRKMEVEIQRVESTKDIKTDVVIDAIFGIGIKGEIREPIRTIITDLNQTRIPVLAIDVPSGLDANTGMPAGTAIRAKKTVTMQFPKKGFYINEGPEHVGEIVVRDIGLLV